MPDRDVFRLRLQKEFAHPARLILKYDSPDTGIQRAANALSKTLAPCDVESIQRVILETMQLSSDSSSSAEEMQMRIRKIGRELNSRVATLAASGVCRYLSNGPRVENYLPLALRRKGEMAIIALEILSEIVEERLFPKVLLDEVELEEEISLGEIIGRRSKARSALFASAAFHDLAEEIASGTTDKFRRTHRRQRVPQSELLSIPLSQIAGAQ